MPQSRGESEEEVVAKIAHPVADIAAQTRGVRFQHIGRLITRDGWRIASHAHPRCYELLVIYSGRHRAQIGREAVLSEAGGALLYPPKCIHSERTLGPHTEWAYASFEWPSAPPDLPTRLTDTTGRARMMGDWLLAEERLMQPARQEIRNAILAQMLIQLITPPPTLHPLVQRVREHMSARLAERVSLDDLARHARLSKYHFLRTYRKLAGKTPMDDLRDLRLARAREIILTTSLPLKTVSSRCGLGDGHALSRLFRRHCGRPPRSLRAGMTTDPSSQAQSGLAR